MGYTYDQNFARERALAYGRMPAEAVEMLADLWVDVVRRYALPGKAPAPMDSLTTRIEKGDGRGHLYFGWYDYKGSDEAARTRFERYREIFAMEARTALEWFRIERELG